MNRLQAHIPNLLTIGRLGIAGVIILLLFVPKGSSLLAVQILALIGVISDKLDGTLARLWNTESDLGKRLESFADPLFSVAVAVYVAIHIGLPQVFLITAGIYAVIGTIGRLIASLLARELFYEKSQVTRVGVGMLFVLLLMYLYSIPYREYLMWVSLGYGAVMTLNYVRLQVLFVLQRTK